MYNGIGLTTPRGSGTNGYIQRNMSFVHKSKEKINYRSEDDLKKLDAMANRKPNEEILAHERKRMIELKCFEMQELMEDQGYSNDEISSKVKVFRQLLLDEDVKREVPKNQFGRPNVKESHQMAEANQEKNMKLKEALGISQYFIEGSSLDPERKAKEAAAAAAADTQKKYLLVPDSSDSSPEREPEKNERKRKLSSASERNEVSITGKKKKTSKKHKKDRSESSDIKKKKKRKRNGKEKRKYKSKTENSHKRKHRNRSKSSSSRSSSSSSSSSSSKNSSSSSSSSSANRSSSVVSSDFGDDRKSCKSKQKRKHTVKTVEDKNHKERKSSRKSQSPGTVRHEDHRSRRDIYEALKKNKHKRNEKKRTLPSSGSSSGSNSSPEQYYRLEPILVKQKSKHKNKHVLEVVKRKKATSPSLDYKSLEKYGGKRKKSYRTSSSSEGDAKKRQDKKKKKHSISPCPRSQDNHSAEKRYDVSERRGGRHGTRKSPKDDESSGRLKKSRTEEINSEKLRSHHQDSSGKEKTRFHSHSPFKHNGFHRSQSARSSASRSPIRSKSRKIHRSHSGSGSEASVKIIRKPDHSSSKRHSPQTPSCSPPRSKTSSRLSASPFSHNAKKDRSSQRDRSKSKNSDPNHSSDRGHVRDHREHNVKNDCRGTRSPYNKRSSTHMRSHSRSVSKTSGHSKSSIKDKTNSNERHRKNNYKNMTESPVHGLSTKEKDVRKKTDFKSKGRRSRSRSDSSSQSESDIEKSVTKRSIHRNRSPHCQNTQLKSKGRVHEDPPKSSKNGNYSGSLANSKGLKHNIESTSKCQSPTHIKSSKRGKDCISHSRSASRSRSRSPVGNKASPKFNDHVNGKRGHSRSQSSSIDRNSKSSKDGHKSRSGKSHSKSVSRSPCNDKLSIQEPDINASSSKTTKQSSAYAGTATDSKHCVDKSKSRSKSDDRSLAHSKSPRRRLVDSRSSSKSPRKCTKSKSRSPVRSKSPRARSLSRSVSPVHSKGHRHSSSRSKSFSRSRSTSSIKSRSKSYSHSRSRSRSKSYSRSHSRSSSSRSRSRSHSKSGARSPSIPRRRGSPSFLDKRRITS